MRRWGAILVLLMVGCGGRTTLFEPAYINIEITHDPGASVVSEPAGIACPPTCVAEFRQRVPVTLIATGSTTDWDIVRWERDCSSLGGGCTFEPATRNNFVRAVFGHPVVVDTIGSGSGTITSDPPGIDCPGSCAAAFEPDTRVSLSATPDAGSTFEQWEAQCAGALPTCETQMDARLTVDARFLGGATISAWSVGGDGTPTAEDAQVDSTGGTVLVGSVVDEVDFGGGLVTADGSDVFVVRYDPSGVYDWAIATGDNAGDRANGVAIGSAGEIVVVGEFEGDADFGAGAVSAGAAAHSSFLVTYSPTGAHTSFMQAGTTDTGAVDVALGANGETHIVGLFTGGIDLGGGTINPGAGFSAFLAKYDAGGHVWSRAVSGTLGEQARAAALLPDGTLVAGGSFTGTITLSGTVTAMAGQEAWVAGFDGGGGTLLWERVGLGGGNEIVQELIAVDGDVIAAGFFQNTITLGATVLTSAGGDDIFIARLDGATGDVLAARSYGSAGDESLGDIAFDGTDLIVAGGFEGTIDFGDGPRDPVGGLDAFLLRIDPMLTTPQWVRTHGGLGDDEATAVAIRPDGSVVAAGTFESTASFGTGSLNAGITADLFLLHAGR